MPKLKPGTILPTDMEDAAITQQAAEDGTLLTDAELAEMKPVSAFAELEAVLRQGSPKQAATIRLSVEVLEFFKAGGKDWQSKINTVLQEYVKAHRSA
jgi:uncharacterized protein (DUF4415 family)